jgi:GNAT superfamily N-acetyltransferase
VIERFRAKIHDFSEKGTYATLRKAYRDHVYGVEHILLLSRRLDAPFPFRRVAMRELEIDMCDTQQKRDDLIATYPDRSAIFRAYFDEGLHVITGRVGRAVVAYVWVATSDFYDASVYRRVFSIADHQIYQFAGFVAPEYRGKPVALLMMRAVDEVFLEKGFKSTLAAVSAENAISVRFHVKCKYLPTGEAFDCHKLLGWRWTRDVEPREEALAPYRR